MDDDIQRVYIECACRSKDHLICVSVDEYIYDDGKIDTSLYIETQMSPSVGFFKRIYLAFKYVLFPQKVCKYGQWSCCEVSLDEALKLQDMVDDYVERLEEVHTPFVN